MRQFYMTALNSFNYQVSRDGVVIGWVTKSLLACNGRWTFTASQEGKIAKYHDTAPDYLTPEDALAGAIDLSAFIERHKENCH